MSTATSGRAREYRVRDHMIAHGWRLVMRSAGSKGCADLALAHPVRGLALVQVGTQNKSIGPADREWFLSLATMSGAIPVLATPVPGIGIRYWYVGPGPASTWQEFTP